MAKEKENMTNEDPIEAQMPESTDAPSTPNRDMYSKMWGEDNNDVDFEDKEARYGRAIEDRNELRERRTADKALGGLFDKNEWLGTMYMELKDNPDINPFVWLANFCQENDLSLDEVMSDPEAQKFLTDKMNKRQKDIADKEAKGKAEKEEKDKNLEKSLDALEQCQKDMGLEDDECLKMWGDFWSVIDEAQKGIVSKDTWKAFSHSRTYDSDLQNASDVAGMKARNEKIQNQIRKPSMEGANLPPTLSNGNGGGMKREPRKRESFLSGLNS